MQSLAVSALVLLLQNPHEEIRAQALEGLSEQARHGAAISADWIEGALRDASPAVRAAALDALVEIDCDPERLDFPALLFDEDPSVRIAAAIAIADLGNKAAMPDLRRLLSDADEIVRLQAAISLAAFKDAAGVDELIAGLALSPRESIEAARAVGHLGEAAPNDAIAALKQISSKRFIAPELKAQAAAALYCCTGQRDGESIIEKFLSSRNPDTRLTMLSILARVPAGAIASMVGRLLEDRDPLVASCAIETLGALATSNRSGAIAALKAGQHHLRGPLLTELHECLAELERDPR